MLLKHLYLSNSIVSSVRRQISSTTRINKSNIETNRIDKENKKLHLLNQTFDLDDEWTNLNQNILTKLGRNVHHQKYHPLNHIINNIKNFFYKKYINRSGNAIFSVHDTLNPIVTVEQNFDSLLVGKNHVSRSKNDCYYVNKNHLLRGHTSAHQYELIKSGLDAFLVFGDVYRRDEIDRKHYPIFHQCEGVRLFNKHDLFKNVANNEGLNLFENSEDRDSFKQETHTLEAMKLLEHDLKKCLTDLVSHLFGKYNLNMKWTETTFPFTHPSWELEIEYKGVWYEVLGCGIIEQKILNNAGAQDLAGWAFGLGLERWAMILYGIPDIRLFWSTDSGFLNQFKHDDSSTIVQYKPISSFPRCSNDISFWLPENIGKFSSNAFYDLVRDQAGDLIEQVELIDNFTNAKTKRTSHCYRIAYRAMDRNLTQKEVNELHKVIEEKVVREYHVKIR